jgi:oxalate decarboxylase
MRNDETREPLVENEGSGVSRRTFVGAAALAGVGLVRMTAAAQTVEEVQAGKADGSDSDPGQENRALLDENPNSNMPPATDRGDVGAIWYSFDLAHKRLQAGGWTHEVTQRVLPTSKEIAGVNMRLTAGSFRELHWHTANEWAYMLTGKARVSVLQPDGKMFIDDVSAGDLWYFPAGFPHSVQGLEGPGCEFLLVFDEGDFSEDDTFLLTDWLAHTPPEILMKNMGWSKADIAQLPKTPLYIFESPLPKPLAADRQFLGSLLETENKYTFKMAPMPATKKTAGGEVRVVDSTNFPASKNIAAGLVRVKPGGMREMHWHPTGSEWQFYLAGKARMTVFNTASRARTMDFNANDVGFVPSMAGHYIENTGNDDLVFLEMFRAPKFSDVSLNDWIARMPPQMAQAHLKMAASAIQGVPQQKYEVLPK